MTFSCLRRTSKFGQVPDYKGLTWGSNCVMKINKCIGIGIIKSHYFSGSSSLKFSKPMLKAGGLKLNQVDKKMRWLPLSKHLHWEWALKAILCQYYEQ